MELYKNTFWQVCVIYLNELVPISIVASHSRSLFKQVHSIGIL